jgi:hypothetical protein
LQTFRDLAALFRQLGALRFVLLFAAISAPLLAYGVVFARLAASIGWPEDYGFTCRRKCVASNMWNSHKLLAGGDGPELMLFALIWFFPVLGVVVSIALLAQRRLKQRRDRIRPLADD